MGIVYKQTSIMSTKQKKQTPERIQKLKEQADRTATAPLAFMCFFEDESCWIEIPQFEVEDEVGDVTMHHGRHICGYGESYEEAKKDFWRTWRKHYPDIFLEFEQPWKGVSFASVMDKEMASDRKEAIDGSVPTR